ncbi:MAG: hypothetical protein ACOC9V_06625 [Chloroflexota bacterium]
MNTQISDLTVTDPLAEQEVTIVVRALPDNVQRPARTALVSVGMSGQPPVFVSGVLEDVADLIRQAWLAYGAQAEVRQAAVEDVGRTDVETVAEAAVGEADGSGGDETPPAAPKQLQPAIRTDLPKPQPQNLSLF